MNKEQFIHQYVILPALNLLGDKYNSTDAQRLLIAIGLQESRLTYRKQIGGPANGYWQFERGGGVKGVLTHKSTKNKIVEVCELLGYRTDIDVVYEKIVDNDLLACVLARLLLYTASGAIPSTEKEAWQYYVNTWRPGKPHPETWSEMWKRAQEVVDK